MPHKLDPSLQIAGLQDRTVADSWTWAYSDLLSNTIRPMFAEYLVGECVQVTDHPRVEWDCVDFQFRGRGIEVKSAGYVQAWQQRSLSTVSFDIASKEQPWDAATNTNRPPGRSADVYVFCVHTDCSRETSVVHDVERWEFYVVSGKAIDDSFGSQKTVRLSRIRGLCSPVTYQDLKAAINAAIDDLECNASCPTLGTAGQPTTHSEPT